MLLALLLAVAPHHAPTAVSLLPTSAVESPAVGLLADDGAISMPPAKLFFSGAAAALFTAPASLLLGRSLGALSSSLLGALLPGLLIPLLIPPIAVVLAEWWLADDVLPGRAPLWVPLLTTFGVQLAIVALSAIGGLNGWSSGGIAAFTLLDAVLLPTAATLTTRALWPPPTPASAPQAQLLVPVFSRSW